MGELLVKKEQLSATRVCGGACSMPNQIGDWCSHANACYTCNYFRADSKGIDFFMNEKDNLSVLINQQQEEYDVLENSGKQRMSEITNRRLQKNNDIFQSLNNIIQAIDNDCFYKGSQRQFEKVSLVTSDD